MTHQATANRWSLSASMLSIVAHILFSAHFCFFGRTDGRTDTTHKNSEHLFDSGLVGQQHSSSPSASLSSNEDRLKEKHERKANFFSFFFQSRMGRVKIETGRKVFFHA